MRDVVVVGVGMNKWGEIWKSSFRDMMVEASLLAIDDAGVDRLDEMFIGTMTSGLFVGQEHVGALVADYLGEIPIPATRLESACASGGVAFRQGYVSVASGMNDIVLVGGVEKMTDTDTGGATFALATAADQEYECFHGLTFPGLYAMMAVAHMHRYGTTRKQLAMVSVKNHAHGSKNPLAQYPSPITVEQVLKSVMVADPLRVLDCSPITDGAAAVILTTREIAQKLGKPIIKIAGSGQATDTLALHSRKNLARLAAVERSGEIAYKMAGCEPKDIDIAEVHDCFTIAEIMAIEALGFVEAGDGGPATERGDTRLGGKIPVNVSGGLKSKGHPVGATGVAQIVELTEQLRGDAGQRQVEGARRGLAQTMGGTGASSTVHILEVE